MDYDVAVLGLGTAGAAAAALCARAGLRVIGLDAAPLDRAGARWINGVPKWAFEEAGLPLPEGAERRGDGATFHMVAGWDGPRARVAGHQVWDVDMRHLVDRLHGLARQSGATLRGEAKVLGWDDGQVRTSAGDFAARTVIDATGLGGAGLLKRPRVAPGDLCVAAQEVRAVRDLQAAREYFERREIPIGETLCYTGVAGGYSIVNVSLHGDELGILTGSIPHLGQPSGRQLLESFVREHTWVGERLFGGSRAIPLAPPHARLAEGPVALLGDAGNQVFAVHGSGIGAQLVGAAMLARTLAAGGTPEDWNLAWQRRYGGQFAGSALFARFSRSLSTDELGRLMQSGLMSPGILRDGLDQRQPDPRLAEIPQLLVGAAREFGLLRRLAPVVARMKALELHYAWYPKDLTKLPAWEARRDSLLAT